jgi:predicted phage terminase large subunit-like protein
VSGLDALDKVDRLLRQVERHVPSGGSEGAVVVLCPTLLERYRAAYPKHLDPRHLYPAFDVYERAKRERVRACIVLPRRAGKTELEKVAAVDRLLLDPDCSVGFAMYGQRVSEKRSSQMQKLFRRLGGVVDPAQHGKTDWRVAGAEGGLWATSVGGAIVGEGFKLLLLDDLLKGRAEAESQLIRDNTFDWVVADALPTLDPTGSAILTTTRWHEDDPAGRLVRDHGWELVHVPALTRELPDGAVTAEPERRADGTPYWPERTTRSYWPERWPLPLLTETMQTMGGPEGYDWVSLYQGSPRAAELGMFVGVHEYDVAPARKALRVAIGLDFGYSKTRRSDWSVAIALGWDGGRFYVLDVLRVQTAEPEDFGRKVRELATKWDALDMLAAYVARTERGNRAVMREQGMHVRLANATEGKVTRALRASAAWSRGDLLVPKAAPWRAKLIGELAAFPNGTHDDQVDALAAAHDVLYGAPAFAAPEEEPTDARERQAKAWERDIEQMDERRRREERTGGLELPPGAKDWDAWWAR